MNKSISIKTAPHYKWSDNCDGWWLKQDGNFTVISERMPPRTAETNHYHKETEQFFYCLHGQLVIEFLDHEQILHEHQGCTISAGIPHKAKNTSDNTVCFLVISSPNSHTDRVNLE